MASGEQIVDGIGLRPVESQRSQVQGLMSPDCDLPTFDWPLACDFRLSDF